MIESPYSVPDQPGSVSNVHLIDHLEMRRLFVADEMRRRRFCGCDHCIADRSAA